MVQLSLESANKKNKKTLLELKNQTSTFVSIFTRRPVSEAL